MKKIITNICIILFVIGVFIGFMSIALNVYDLRKDNAALQAQVIELKHECEDWQKQCEQIRETIGGKQADDKWLKGD